MRLRITTLLLAATVLTGATGCRSTDSDRLPPAPVRISFATYGDWHTYGVAGAMESRRFVLSERQPAGFPYSAGSATGYGGVLLAGQYTYGGSPQTEPPVAFDLACPVEARADVRVTADAEKGYARCERCGSTYDIFSGTGAPLSGPAAQEGYGMTRYRVTANTGNQYIMITN